ncbi:hypothetical protein GCM10010502_64650 [Kitasatospora aureofaciens]|uniref:Uncharacterized protein n=1 Tax=Kitasatospora aureofaciens TaxID=1894 RepID=A0A8H9LR31_KITAU|nr:hypothetical protein GCM10010502_64650 [Kitasatospora aureofaciens]
MLYLLYKPFIHSRTLPAAGSSRAAPSKRAGRVLRLLQQAASWIGSGDPREIAWVGVVGDERTQSQAPVAAHRDEHRARIPVLGPASYGADAYGVPEQTNICRPKNLQ